MTLFLIGLGLGDERDITVKGLERVKNCDKVYLEHYTSILGVQKEKLEGFYGKDIILADRDMVEKNAEEILNSAKNNEVAFLVVGDPFGATTHTDLVLRAKEMGIGVSVIHNASILNAVGVVGLELYKYGKTTSIPFWEEGFEPETPYDVIVENKERGLHTLCLLDIKVKEPTKDELRSGKTEKEPEPRFMTVRQGLKILLDIEMRRVDSMVTLDTMAIGVARLGQPDQMIVAAPIEKLLTVDFGEPLHSLIIPGNLQVVEGEAIEQWR